MQVETFDTILAAWRDELGFTDDPALLARAGLRLMAAVLLAAVLGYERERRDSSAGLRTHMLVGLGAALFIVTPMLAGLSPDELGRVLQGVVTGIGFLGAGAIIKVSEREEVKGLTTAAGIWATSAIAITAAMGRIWMAIFVTLIAYAVLDGMMRWESRIRGDKDGRR